MFLPDSDCMIAAVSQWHVHHIPASSEIDRRLSTGEPMVIAAPALVETYAVLTRLPRLYRLPPETCLTLVHTSFLANAERVIALDADAYIGLIERAAVAGTGGGRISDAVIAACGRAVGVDAVLTFNERHFLPFAGQGMAIIVPRADGAEAHD